MIVFAARARKDFKESDRIRDDFLLRTQVLERIRSDLYLSGTDVRDYLLEPNPGRAEGHRYTLLETRKDMDRALEQYSHLLGAGEAQPFRILTQELAAYWRVLEPTFAWTAAERQQAGYAFLRDEVESVEPRIQCVDTREHRARYFDRRKRSRAIGLEQGRRSQRAEVHRQKNVVCP